MCSPVLEVIANNLDQCAAEIGGCEKCCHQEKCYALFWEIDEDRLKRSSNLITNYTKQFLALSATRQITLSL